MALHSAPIAHTKERQFNRDQYIHGQRKDQFVTLNFAGWRPLTQFYCMELFEEEKNSTTWSASSVCIISGNTAACDLDSGRSFCWHLELLLGTNLIHTLLLALAVITAYFRAKESSIRRYRYINWFFGIYFGVWSQNRIKEQFRVVGGSSVSNTPVVIND